MKSKILLLGVLGAMAILVAACGGHDNGSSPPATTTPPSSSMALDTAQVLAMAQVISETSSPIAVNGGAVTLTDTSETSSPIAVTQ